MIHHDAFGPASVEPPVPTTPAQSPALATRAARRRGPWRWLVAAVATLALILGSTGLVAFAQTAAEASIGPTFLPADTPIYVEARLDLPAGQDESLTELLANFPGFADGAALDSKVAQALDQMLASQTDGTFTYSADVASWFGGQVALGLPGIAVTSVMSEGSGVDQPLLAGASVTDPTALEAFLAKVRESDESGATYTDEPYLGTTVTTVASGGQPMAYAATDNVFLLATSADLVKQGLDVLAGERPSLAADPDFAASFERLPAGRLGALYADISAFGPLIEVALAEAGQQTAGLGELTGLLEQLPLRLSAYLAAAPDHLTLGAVAVPGPATPALAIRETDLAARFPADTVLYIEGRDIGRLLEQGLSQLRPQIVASAGEEGLADVEQILGVPIEQALSFVGDLALGASVGDDGIGFGLAATIVDAAAAEERLDTILGLLRLQSVTAEEPVFTIDTTTVDGVRVTTISFTAAAGLDSLPITPKISIAVANGELYLGLGDFAAQAISRPATESLAGSARYGAALAAAGTPNAGVVWADIAALIEAVTAFGGTDADFRENIQPYLDPLDQLIASGTDEDGQMGVQILLFVR